MNNNELFSHFESVSEQQWKEKIISDLRGKDYDSTLLWVDENGITHAPFYHQENLKNNPIIEAIQAAQKANADCFFVCPSALQTGYYSQYTENLKNGEVNHLSALVKQLREAQKEKSIILIDGNFFRQAGGTILQELTYTLQIAVDYFDAGTESGMTAQEIAPLLEFKLGFGTSYCSEIAKARAFRYLIQQIYEGYAVQHTPIVFGEACNYYHSHKDPHNNLLRLSTQAMSIQLGNCDSVVLPAFDEIGEASSLGKRMSENIMHIMKEESFLSEVQDIAKGSYYIEKLSEQIAQKCWNQFLAVEVQGGLLAYANSGALQRELNASHTERVKKYKAKKEVLLGANTYINENSTDLSVESITNKGIMTYILSNEIDL